MDRLTRQERLTMPNTRLSDRLSEHLNRVECLAIAGISPPPEWDSLRERLTDYQRLPLKAADRLVAAVVAPTKGADVTELHALALAETASPPQQAEVDNQVTAAVEHRLLEIYSKVAQANYKKAAASFDAIAKNLARAVSTVDPETPAAVMARVDTPDEHRRAWSDAETAAHQLTALVELLIAAAELAGTTIDLVEGVPALCVDFGSLHRRRAWEAWETGNDTRTQRWGAVTKLGATIRACPLDEFQPYRRPALKELRQEQVPGAPRGTIRQYEYDPEDGYQAEAINPFHDNGRLIAG
jgi:hypothetical protein